MATGLLCYTLLLYRIATTNKHAPRTEERNVSGTAYVQHGGDVAQSRIR
jgi:hypothetical protein